MILVTGATGHVGRHVVDQLSAAEESVRALTRNPDNPNLPTGAEVATGTSPTHAHCGAPCETSR
jgi:uncharacterized protein YbjT (DUF2867 family)